MCVADGNSLKLAWKWAFDEPIAAKWLHAIKLITYRSENHWIYMQITTNNCETLESNTISVDGTITLEEINSNLTMFPLK